MSRETLNLLEWDAEERRYEADVDTVLLAIFEADIQVKE